MNSITIQIQIIVNIIVSFIGYEPMFDFSSETYMVIVFDGITIKERTYITARDAMDAKRVFVSVGWSVEVNIINNIFDNK